MGNSQLLVGGGGGGGGCAEALISFIREKLQ